MTLSDNEKPLTLEDLVRIGYPGAAKELAARKAKEAAAKPPLRRAS